MEDAMSRGTGRWGLSRAGWLRVVEVPAEFVPLIWGSEDPPGPRVSHLRALMLMKPVASIGS